MKRPTSRDRRDYHGLGGTPTYVSWYSMVDRCMSEKSTSWPSYGARGIKVCERWLDIRNFVADMGLRPAGTTLDRINVHGNYEPGNCRWATDIEQQRNRRGVILTEDKAREIRRAASAGMKQRAIAEMFGISRSNVSRVVSGNTWVLE